MCEKDALSINSPKKKKTRLLRGSRKVGGGGQDRTCGRDQNIEVGRSVGV